MSAMSSPGQPGMWGVGGLWRPPRPVGFLSLACPCSREQGECLAQKIHDDIRVLVAITAPGEGQNILLHRLSVSYYLLATINLMD